MTLVALGPSGPDKTNWLLAHYRTALGTAQWGRCLWLTATTRASAEIRDALLGDTEVFLSPGVSTLADLADVVSKREQHPPRHLTSAVRRHLLGRIVQSAHKQGRMEFLNRIADKPGFVDLLDEFIRGAERWGISPEALVKSAGHRGDAAKQKELAELLAEFHDVLAKHQLADANRTLWQTSETLERDTGAKEKTWQLVVVDGFSSFSAAQLAILDQLARCSDELIISLPVGEPQGQSDPRADLFAEPLKTLADLKRRHPHLKTCHVERSAGSWPAMDHLAKHLFCNPRKRPKPSPEVVASIKQIKVVSASSEQDEIVQIARRVKELLISDKAKAEDVGVVFRTLHDVAPRVEEVFGEFGIPYSIEVQRPLIGSPALRTLLGLVRLADNDWPYRQLLAVVNNRLLSGFDSASEENRAAAERIVRELQITHGRDKLFNQIDYWADRFDQETTGQRDEPITLQSIKAARAILDQLAGALDALPQQATPGDWLGALAAIGKRLGLAPFAPAQKVIEPSPQGPNERAAWERLEAAVAGVEQLSAWLDEAAPTWTSREMLRNFGDIATNEFLPKPHGDSGRVLVLSATTVRTLSLPHVFLAGLSEKSFPRPDRAGRLYSEADFQFIANVANQEENRIALKRQQEEMLLFYQVVTSATQSLTLSYPALDQKAQTLPPSPYLQDLAGTFGEDHEIEIPSPQLMAPTYSESPLSPSQWQIAAVTRAHEDRDTRLLAGLLTDPQMIIRGQSIVSALRAIHWRSRGDLFGAMEGTFDGEGVRRLLAQRFGADHLWSPSQLEAYAQCPFRFLMEHVLKLVPLRDLTLETDVMRRGMLLHDALAGYHRHAAKEGVKTAAVDGPALLEILKQRVEARGGSAIDSALVEIEHRQLQAWAEKYPDQEAIYRKHWADLAVSLSPQHLEIRFGPSRHGEPKSSEDSHSTDEPFVLDIGGEKVKFTGRIDRVDVGQAGERTVFTVIDYKSGKKLSLSEEEMEAGRQLQLPLYVMAAQVLFFEKTQGVPVSAGFWKVRGGGLREKDTLTPYELTEDGPQESEAWKRRQESLRSRVRELIDGIRRGEFPMDNVDEECTNRCSFASVCRVSQVRSIGKARESDVADSAAARSPSKPAKAVATS